MQHVTSAAGTQEAARVLTTQLTANLGACYHAKRHINTNPDAKINANPLTLTHNTNLHPNLEFKP